MDNDVTGAAIRSLREAKGLTQEELAARIHVSAKTVSKWETGRSFPTSVCWNPRQWRWESQ